METNGLESFRAVSRLYSDTSILMHEAIARRAGLSGTDHKYLGIIVQKGELTAGELAQRTGLTTGAVTGLIDRLEKKKLVKRQFAKDDRRKVMIVPNLPNIEKLLTPLFKSLLEKTVKLISSFSEEEVETIKKYFSQAVQVMNETIEELNNDKKE